MTKSFKKTRYEFTNVPRTTFTKDIGVYIHVPFCFTKCSFCPFYKELYNDELKGMYVDSISKEISSTEFQGNTKWVYFGGGTPNTLTINDLTKITTTLRNKVKITNMGIELLPSLLTKDYLDGLYSIGFSKISIGIETFTKETHKEIKRKGSDYDHISEYSDLFTFELNSRNQNNIDVCMGEYTFILRNNINKDKK